MSNMLLTQQQQQQQNNANTTPSSSSSLVSTNSTSTPTLSPLANYNSTTSTSTLIPSATLTVSPHQQQQLQLNHLLAPTTATLTAIPSPYHGGYKDTRWLTLEVCREFQRNKCNRSENECKFAHPPAHVEITNGKVIACYDSLKVCCCCCLVSTKPFLLQTSFFFLFLYITSKSESL